MAIGSTFLVGLLEHPFLFICFLIALLVTIAMCCAFMHMTYDFILRVFNRSMMPSFGGYFDGDDGSDGGDSDNVPTNPDPPGVLTYSTTSKEELKDEEYICNKENENELWRQSKWE